MRIISDLIRDMRHAGRSAWRHRGFAAATIATLSVVLGANATVFSAVNAILLRPLPYPNADQLVRLVENVPAEESRSGRPERSSTMAPGVFADWRQRTGTLSHMAMHLPIAVTLRERAESVRLVGWRVSAGMLPMFDVKPVAGRLFTLDDERGAPVTMLSEEIWTTRFGRDPAIVGRQISLDDAGHTVIGVVPRGFAPFDGDTDIWMPFAADADGPIFRLGVLARLRDGVSMAQAQADVDRLLPEVLGVPAQGDAGAPAHRVEVVRWQDELTEPVRRTLPMLMAAVSLVLLIACVNVSNLFTAHAVRRRQEMAIRAALGARRGRLVRQVFAESLTLAILGGVGGAALTVVGTAMVTRMGRGLDRTDLAAAGGALPRVEEISIDATVLAYVAALSVLVAVACSVTAMWRLRRRTIAIVSPSSSAASTLSGAPVLIAAQATLTVVLTVGALLLLRSFSTLASVDPGYDARDVLTFQLAPHESPSPTEFVAVQARQLEAADRLLSRIRALPGVGGAAFTSGLPMVEGRYLLSLRASGAEESTPIEDGRMILVSPEYFNVMRMEMLLGRGFDAADGQRSDATFVINRTLARRYFGTADPIGRRVSVYNIPGEIAGVVEDTHATTLDLAPQPQLFMTAFRGRQYLPILDGGLYFTVRTDAIDAVRAAIPGLTRELALDATIQRVATMEQILATSTTTQRAYAAIVGTLAVGALALVAVGIYAVIAYLIGQRTREIAIRVAVGAPRGDVLRFVVRDGLVAVVVGASLGLAAALVIAPSLRGLLFGVRPLDAVTFTTAPALLVLVATAASALAARRALRIEPMSVLRSE